MWQLIKTILLVFLDSGYVVRSSQVAAARTSCRVWKIIRKFTFWGMGNSTVTLAPS